MGTDYGFAIRTGEHAARSLTQPTAQRQQTITVNGRQKNKSKAEAKKLENHQENIESPSEEDLEAGKGGRGISNTTGCRNGPKGAFFLGGLPREIRNQRSITSHCRSPEIR